MFVLEMKFLKPFMKFFLVAVFIYPILKVSAANAQGGVDEWYWPAGHTGAVSHGWPATSNSGTPGVHDHYWSLKFGRGPANHAYVLSRTWYTNPKGPVLVNPDTPNHPINHHLPDSKNKGWPPNHHFIQSREWIGHNVAISRGWTAGHSNSVSRSWPGVNDHDLAATRLWPPNHSTNVSLTHSPGSPDDHLESISSQLNWPLPAHNATLSGFWPPNHYRSTSVTWSNTHNRSISASWSGNHFGPLSNTWPSGGGVYWPPNHDPVTSNGWGTPSTPDWPVFPPDHTWLTTATAISGLVPSPSTPVNSAPR